MVRYREWWSTQDVSVERHFGSDGWVKGGCGEKESVVERKEDAAKKNSQWSGRRARRKRIRCGVGGEQMKGERCRRETKGHEMLRWEDASVVMVKGGGKVLDVAVGRHVSGGSEGRRANPRGKVLDVVTERNLRCEMMKRRVEVGSWQEVREKVTAVAIDTPATKLPAPNAPNRPTY